MTVSDLPAGIHEITVINFNGCRETIAVIIRNTDMANTVTVSATSAACEGGMGEYIVGVTGSISQIRVDGHLIAGAGTYPASAGVHYVEFTDNTGCVGYDTFAISGGSALSMSYAVGAGDCQSTDLAIDAVISGGRAPYTVNGITTATGVLTLTDLSAGHNVIEVKDADSCSRIFEFDMHIGHPIMLSDTGIVGSICSGDEFRYTPEANVFETTCAWTRYAVAGISEDYATGLGAINETLTNILDIPVTVTYEYIITGTGACYLSDTVLVEVIVNPVSSLFMSHTPANGSRVVLGTPVTIEATTAGAEIHTYTFEDMLGRRITQIRGEHPNPDIFSVYEFNERETNTILVEAINDYGCITMAEEEFNVEYDVPNVITPKEITNSRLLTGYDIQVFNRWGSELYRGTDGWDGTYKGTLVASGTYFYILRYTQPNGQPLLIKRSVFVRY